jgi:transcriptional regulator with XRE-family HTH domain
MYKYPAFPIERHVINFVRQARMERHLSQSNLCDLLQVCGTFVGNVESLRHPAKYNLQHINTLAWFLEVPPADFLPKQAFDPDINLIY